MPSCVLRYCLNNSRNTSKTNGVTFHQFPRPGDEKRELWIKFVQKKRSEETWLPSEYSRVCSMHFNDDDKYTTKTGRIYLKKSAVPRDNTIESGEIVSELSESVSSESIFDNPKEIALKKQLSQESEARKELAEKFKKMQRQNIYLKKKCETYETVFHNLKSKFGLDLNILNGLVAQAEAIDLFKSLLNKQI